MSRVPVQREFWGGLTLVSIWLAVLFVGVFGGDIETAGADGSASSVPVVVVVAVVALLATISVGRWAFPQRSAEDRGAAAGRRGDAEPAKGEVISPG